MRRDIPSTAKTVKAFGKIKDILIVDDQELMRLITKNLLRGIGAFRVDEASDGKEALEKLKRKSYDLIISDWDMEVMEGLEFLQTVRKDPVLKDVPLIMMTAEGRPERIRQAIESGASGYMLKPLSRALLIQKINAL